MKTKGKWDHARVLHICTCPNNAAMNAHVDKCSFDLWRGEIFAIHCIALACVLHLTASGQHCGQEAGGRSWGPVKHYCHLEALYFVSKVRNIFYLELAWAGTMLEPGTRLD